MCSDRKLLKVRRYRQLPGECSVAAAASVANFYDKRVDYTVASAIAKNDGDGMYTPDIGILLNQLGFSEVTIISADLHKLDFKWKDLGKIALINQLTKERRHSRDAECREVAKEYIKFLTDPNSNNNLIIDHHFGDHIRSAIDSGKPALASFNWNLFFEFPKWNDAGTADPIKGEAQEHEIVIRGYDNEGVYIVDSHYQLYRGRLSKYRNGRYKMRWETLMTVMGFGDLIIPSNHLSERIEVYELV